MMRMGRLFLFAFALTACRDEGYSVGDASYDPSLLTSSGGEVSLADGTHLDFLITSDRFKQWDAARRGFSRGASTRFGALLKPSAPTERTIQRAISYLESESNARQAIERTGMTVRDFVLMTVALEQQMRLATRRRTPGYPSEMPVSIDTPLPTAGDLGPSYPYDPLPADSARVTDTILLPSPRDTGPVRRDTLRPAREPVRDTLRLPSRDTSRLPRRDTTRAPGDTLTSPDTIQAG